MKRTLIALAALTIAAPAVAQQVPAGAKAAEAHFAQSETGTEARVLIDSAEGISPAAAAIAQNEIRSDETRNSGNTVRFNTSTDMFANDTARDIFMGLEMEEEGNAS